MKRGSLLCAKCKVKRGDKDRSCPHCGHDTVFIRVKYHGEYPSFWYDPSGRPLSHTEGLKLLYRMNQDRNFHPDSYRKSSLEQSLFEKMADKWLADKEAAIARGEFSPGTFHLYRTYNKNYFMPFFAGKSVHEVQEADIKKFWKQLPLDLSSHYRHNLYMALKAFFGWLYDAGEITVQVKFPRIKKPISRKLEPLIYEEQQAAIDRIPMPYQDFFRFCSELALRMGEACAVKVGDVNLTRRTVTVQRAYSYRKLRNITKGREPRVAYMSEVALEIAERHITPDKLPSAFLLTYGNARGYRPDWVRRLWRKYSGVENTCEEAMRHSTLSDLADDGANAYQIQKIAGHKDIRTSQAYVSSSELKVKELMERKKRKGRKAEVISLPQK
jgi:integrase